MNEKLKELCESITQHIRRAPYKWGFWCVTITFILIPLLIWILYFIGDNCRILINTSLSVGEALGVYGASLAAIGTIALGVVSIIQNNRATQLNLKLIEEQHRAQLPVFSVLNTTDLRYKIEDQKWDIGFLHGADIGFELQNSAIGGHEIGYITFGLKNISNFQIYGLKIVKATLHTIGGIDFQRFMPVFEAQNGMASEETKKISVSFIASSHNFMGIDKNKVQINLAFECYNPQNYRVQFHISFIIYNGKLRSLGEQVLSEYCKEATTDDKT